MIDKDDVDFIIGLVYLGVVMGMIKLVRNKDFIMIIFNVGVNVVIGVFC